MQKNRQNSIKQYQDTEIDFTDCCTTVIRKVESHKENIERYDSEKTLKYSREKGISITSKSTSKLLTNFNKPHQLNIRLQDKPHPNSISPTKQMEPLDMNNSEELTITNGMSISKKVLHIQRCLDYKNKKILEHNNKNGLQEVNQSKFKDNQLQSTRKNTFRTSKESIINMTNIKNAQSFLQKPVDVSNTHKSKDQHSQKKLQVHGGNKRNEKTLSKLYEQSKGQSFLTVQSVQSENGDLQSGNESIIVPFSFKNNLSA